MKKIILSLILLGSVNSLAANLNWNDGIWGGTCEATCQEGFHKDAMQCVPDVYSPTFSQYLPESDVSEPCQGFTTGNREIVSCVRDHDLMSMNISYCADPNPTTILLSPQGTAIIGIDDGHISRTCEEGQITGTDVVSCNSGFSPDGLVCVQNPEPFELVVDGSTGEVIIRVLPNTANDELSVDWGDGTVDVVPYSTDYQFSQYNEANHTYQSGNAADALSHFYSANGSYTVKISGKLRRDTNTSITNNKLIEIKKWGYFKKVTNTSRLFLGESKFTTLSATDWDLNNVTEMISMFLGASVFNSPVNFNTANVTDMSTMFSGAAVFNQPVNFNTQNVISLFGMFNGAREFNQPLNFDTGKVTSLRIFLQNAVKFNSPIVFSDTSKVTTMAWMFYENTLFNQPINFNTENVTDMQSMFARARNFNQEVNFNTVKVTTMANMFNSAEKFNKPISFNAPALTATNSMFLYGSVMNSPISLLNTGNLLNTSNMFQFMVAFNSTISIPNVSSVTNMASMFSNMTVFNQNLSTMRFKSNVTQNNYDAATPAWQAQNKPKFDLP